MTRREFVMAGAAVGLVGKSLAAGCGCRQGGCGANAAGGVALNLCLQWGAIPTADDINAKLDYLEANGFQAVEIPTGKTGEWVLKHGEAVAVALKGRKLFLATACGPSDFSYADAAKREAEVQKFLPVLKVLGAIGSKGLILCPARAKPEMGLAELREDFVTNTGKRLADAAEAAGTKIVLEPLQRKETPFLRQVADGAKMAQEMGPGATVMGDFWHMSKEEPSQYAAFMAAEGKLQHVHIASLATRRIPGLDGAADDYRHGFRALKELKYAGAVSMEAGWPVKGKDAKGKPIFPPPAEKHELILKMRDLLRAQWAEV